MKKLCLLFNHQLTAAQQSDARRSLGVAECISPPAAVLELWKQLPPDVVELYPLLKPVRSWLAKTAEPGDYVLIQGDFGAVYLMIRFALKQQLFPVYSTTRRQAVEEHLEDGAVKMVHAFRHVLFRRYGI